MARRVLTIAVVAALAVAMATAVGASVPARAAGGATNEPAWPTCRGGMQCTSFAVPASYDDPSGPQLSIAAARVPAGDSSRRIGSLVVNPGGPGLSAIDVLTRLVAMLPASITDRFDIVAIDPRGVGRSAPVDCNVPLDPVFDHSFAPTTARERDALVAALQGVADACAAHDGARLTEVSSADTARDMDVLRARMGDEQLTYLGFSYGTYLGALYAALFPSHVRALVLDGPVDPSVDARASTLLQARGFERSLDDFLAWCSARDDCAFGADGDPATAYDALRARIAMAPMPVDPSASGDRAGSVRLLNDTRLDAAVVEQLYGGRAAWPALAEALAEAARGHGDRLLAAADRFFGREPGGGDDGSVEAFWAVGCLDDPTAVGLADLQVRAQEVAPRVGAFVTNFGLACSVWPTRALPRTVVPSFDGAAPEALVVGTTRDPATPLVGAKGLARLLGGAALVVAPGNRHTAIGSGNECVDETVARYLVSPQAPMPSRRRC
ncbi:MAG: alpha/beta hydrolase [Acidimicrobiia bacterium]